DLPHSLPRPDALPISGARVYATACAKCHGEGGEGTAVAPPVWGTHSYNIGAGMARVRTAAAFISDNMPFDQPGTLTDQQALDVRSEEHTSELQSHLNL